MNTRKLVMITCYDATFAKIACEAEAFDYLLVGDSLGMVIRGDDSTLKVKLDHMVYHTEAVAAGIRKARVESKPLLIADMPVSTYDTPSDAIANAKRLLAAGASIVKVEGPVVDVIKALRSEGISVCGHIGLTPQSVQEYRLQGKTDQEAARLLREAVELERAGVSLLVLEMIPASLAKKITEEIRIPTIGIGAGPFCAGQVLVIYDLLGMNPDFHPRFLKKYSRAYDWISEALKNYSREVRESHYPSAENSFQMPSNSVVQLYSSSG